MYVFNHCIVSIVFDWIVAVEPDENDECAEDRHDNHSVPAQSDVS